MRKRRRQSGRTTASADAAGPVAAISPDPSEKRAWFSIRAPPDYTDGRCEGAAVSAVGHRSQISRLPNGWRITRFYGATYLFWRTRRPDGPPGVFRRRLLRRRRQSGRKSNRATSVGPIWRRPILGRDGPHLASGLFQSPPPCRSRGLVIRAARIHGIQRGLTSALAGTECPLGGRNTRL